MTIAVVQSITGSGSGTGLQTAKTLGSTPTAGNLLIAFVHLGSGITDTTITFNEPGGTSGWEVFDKANAFDDSNPTVTALFRYVQVGDTTTLPAFATAGSAFHAWSVVEYSGLTGSWATDYQGSRYQWFGGSTASVSVVPPILSKSANCFAVLAHAKYNRSANASLSAGWTSDQNSNNSGNYGSWGVAHQAVASAGTDIGATVTFQSSSDPQGAMIVMLCTSQPTVPTIVRVRAAGGSSSHPDSIKLGGKAKDGNLLLAYVNWRDNTAASPTFNTGNWTSFASATGATPQIFGYYRYASSEVRALPQLTSAGSDFWTVTIIEITGVPATFSFAHGSDKTGADTTNATVTSTSDSTTGNNDLALTIWAEYNATVVSGGVSGTVDDGNWLDASHYGTWILGRTFAPSAGTTIQSTYTKTGSSAHVAYIQSIFKPTPTGESGSGSMDFAGIGISGIGGTVIANSGTGSLAFGGIRISASGHLTHVKGTGTMAFTGITIHAYGVNDEPGLRQFWTF